MSWFGLVGAVGCLYGFLMEDGKYLSFGLLIIFICLVIHEIKGRRE